MFCSFRQETLILSIVAGYFLQPLCETRLKTSLRIVVKNWVSFKYVGEEKLATDQRSETFLCLLKLYVVYIQMHFDLITIITL